MSRVRPTWRERRSFGFWVLCVLVSLVVGVVAAAVVAVVVASRPATYQSEATLTIDQPLSIALSQDPGVVAKLVALRVEYTGLANTETFASMVASSSGLPASTIRAAVVTSASPNSLLFQLGAQSHSQAQAQQVAAAVASEMTKYATSQQQTAGVPAKARVQLSVVTPAGYAVKISPSHKKEYGAAIIAGVVGFIAALSLQVLRLQR